jgi:hypothetical protein
MPGRFTAPLPLVGRGWGWGVAHFTRSFPRRREPRTKAECPGPRFRETLA